MPFVQDGIRDGEHIRDWMHGCFRERLQATGQAHAQVSDNEDECLAQAVAAIERHWPLIWRFAAPLG
ncbi:MAG: transcriptional regulator [Moraxellaceae bacterium]|jgi:hypothetical protein|nr:transcriptional regulator [Moraxellaceae bacterium]